MTPHQEAARRAVEQRIEALNLKRTELAERIGVDRSAVTRFLNGQVWPIRSTLDRYDKALGWPEGTLSALGRGEQPANIGERRVNVTRSISQTDESRSASGAPPTALFNWLSAAEKRGYTADERALIEAQAFAAALEAAAKIDASRAEGT